MQNHKAIIHAVVNACTYEATYQRLEYQSQALIEATLICKDRVEEKAYYILEKSWSYYD